VLASQIIRSLPESLDWMVLFDLSTLRRMVADETVRGMFSLPESTDLDLHSHVILTSRGTLAAAREGSKLIDPANETVFCAGETVECLYRWFPDRFDLFPVDEVDCLAVVPMPPLPPVLLHLRAEAGYGEAKAVFAEDPSGRHYELLKAVWVEYLGGAGRDRITWPISETTCRPTYIRENWRVLPERAIAICSFCATVR
jgi:hypothetical protein